MTAATTLWSRLVEHRAEWRAHRRTGNAGAYPGVDRPFTWAQKRAWDRAVTAAGHNAAVDGYRLQTRDADTGDDS